MTAVYKTMLDREPDTGGQAYWVGLLDKGCSYNMVINGFCGSQEFIGLCNEYLCSDGYINAKVLLVDTLIRQEICEEIKMTDEGMEYEFIPKYQLPAAESDAYISGSRYLNETFMKEPSKLRIALDLLYKELMLSLPVNMDEDEGIALSRDIVAYVNRAFGDED